MSRFKRQSATNETASIEETIQMTTKPEIISFEADISKEINIKYYDTIPIDVIIYRINTKTPQIGVALHFASLVKEVRAIANDAVEPKWPAEVTDATLLKGCPWEIRGCPNGCYKIQYEGEKQSNVPITILQTISMITYSETIYLKPHGNEAHPVQTSLNGLYSLSSQSPWSTLRLPQGNVTEPREPEIVTEGQAIVNALKDVFKDFLTKAVPALQPEAARVPRAPEHSSPRRLASQPTVSVTAPYSELLTSMMEDPDLVSKFDDYRRAHNIIGTPRSQDPRQKQALEEFAINIQTIREKEKIAAAAAAQAEQEKLGARNRTTHPLHTTGGPSNAPNTTNGAPSVSGLTVPPFMNLIQEDQHGILIDPLIDSQKQLQPIEDKGTSKSRDGNNTEDSDLDDDDAEIPDTMINPKSTIDGIDGIAKETQSMPLQTQKQTDLLETASGGKSLRSSGNISGNGSPQYGHPSYLDENQQQFVEDMIAKWNEADPAAVISKEHMHPLVKFDSGTNKFTAFFKESNQTIRHRIDQLCKQRKEFGKSRKGKWDYIRWTIADNNKVIFD